MGLLKRSFIFIAAFWYSQKVINMLILIVLLFIFGGLFLLHIELWALKQEINIRNAPNTFDALYERALKE